MGIKQMFEQKTAFDVGNSKSEYNKSWSIEKMYKFQLIMVNVHNIQNVNSELMQNGLEVLIFLKLKYNLD
jgi:hypothetical protein